MQAMAIRGLIQRDAVGAYVLTETGHAVFAGWSAPASTLPENRTMVRMWQPVRPHVRTDQAAARTHHA